MQFVTHIRLDFLHDLKFTPECKEIPFISFHIGKFDLLSPVYNFHIEFARDIQDDLLGNAGGNDNIE